MMSIQRLLKLELHPLRIRLRQSRVTPIAFNESIDPFVVKGIKFERVLGRIYIRSKIVAGESRDSRDDARSRSAGCADDQRPERHYRDWSVCMFHHFDNRA